MYCCKDFSSISVLSLYEGELLGVVDKLFFDKNLKKLVEVELVGEDGVKLSLPTKNIYHVGKNAITIRNNQAVSIKIDSNNLCSNPTESKAYTIKGEFIGIIKEVYFNDKYLTQKIELENGNFLETNLVASCGKNTTIFYEKDNVVDIKKFTPNKKQKSSNTNYNQAESETDKAVINTKTESENKDVENENKKEKNIVQVSDFLIGRTCTKDIFNFNNEILIKAHSIINKKNLKEISKFGKLRELMLFSK